jgi:hypothetical protein
MSGFFKKAILKPVFEALAAPGLGNPHTPYEVELLAANVKKVAIVPQSIRQDQRLTPMFSYGDLVEVAHHKFDMDYSIYCHPEQSEDIKALCPILSDICTSQREASPEESAAIGKQFAGGVNLQNFKVSAEQIEHLDKERAPVLLRTFKGAVMEKQGDQSHVLEERVKNGTLARVDFKAANNIYVVANKDSLSDAQELDRLGYGKARVTDIKAHHARIGELLGYTSNDIAWHSGEKYQNPFITKLMEATRSVRQYARKELMLMKGP